HTRMLFRPSHHGSLGVCTKHRAEEMYRAMEWSTGIGSRQALPAFTELRWKRTLAPDKHQDPKTCVVHWHFCGHVVFFVFLAFLFAGPAAGQPVAIPASPSIKPATTDNQQTRRRNPFYWGTNAVLYDAQDVDLIGSLGDPGRVGARVTFYWSD